MDALTLIIIAALTILTIAIIGQPLWQQNSPDAMGETVGPGQTLTEVEARYQAALVSIKDLMFDHEMGKVSAEDYQLLLHKAKQEAASLRRKIDRLTDEVDAIEITPDIDDQIEAMVARTRRQKLNTNGNRALLREIDSDLEVLKRVRFVQETNEVSCPHCGHAAASDDAFCAGCGQSLTRATAPANAHSYCPGCGTPAQKEDAFCTGCGTALTTSRHRTALSAT